MIGQKFFSLRLGASVANSVWTLHPENNQNNHDYVPSRVQTKPISHTNFSIFNNFNKHIAHAKRAWNRSAHVALLRTNCRAWRKGSVQHDHQVLYAVMLLWKRRNTRERENINKNMQLAPNKVSEVAFRVTETLPRGKNASDHSSSRLAGRACKTKRRARARQDSESLA